VLQAVLQVSGSQGDALVTEPARILGRGGGAFRPTAARGDAFLLSPLPQIKCLACDFTYYGTQFRLAAGFLEMSVNKCAIPDWTWTLCLPHV
jgi:hypothetical protein